MDTLKYITANKINNYLNDEARELLLADIYIPLIIKIWSVFSPITREKVKKILREFCNKFPFLVSEREFIQIEIKKVLDDFSPCMVYANELRRDSLIFLHLWYMMNFIF